MLIASLDTLIQFLENRQVDDGLQRKSVFAPVGDPVWASKKDVSDGEKWRAGQEQAWTMARFVVRNDSFTSTIGPLHRLALREREYEILGIKEIGGRSRYLEVTAIAKV